MAADTKARKFSISWDGGYLTTTRYVLEAIYGDDFMEKVGSGKAKTIAVKGHSRTRVIGQPSKTVGSYSYSLIEYPSRTKGAAAGGQPIKILIGEDWWTARLGGSVQDFKTFLAGTGKPDKAFTFTTERGREYTSSN